MVLVWFGCLRRCVGKLVVWCVCCCVWWWLGDGMLIGSNVGLRWGLLLMVSGGFVLLS